MGVDLHGDGAVGVAGQLLHDLGVDAGARQAGEVAVAQLVEAVALGAEARAVAAPPLLEHVGGDAGVGLGDHDGRGRAYGNAALPLRLLVLGEGLHQLGREGKLPAARGGLGGL